jgi:peptidoglycan hydrolase-like protein with peptidoglycan-binding domain
MSCYTDNPSATHASHVSRACVFLHRFVDEGGNPDGFFGSATRAALRDNQAAKGKVVALKCAAARIASHVLQYRSVPALAHATA